MIGAAGAEDGFQRFVGIMRPLNRPVIVLYEQDGADQSFDGNNLVGKVEALGTAADASDGGACRTGGRRPQDQSDQDV